MDKRNKDGANQPMRNAFYFYGMWTQRECVFGLCHYLRWKADKGIWFYPFELSLVPIHGGSLYHYSKLVVVCISYRVTGFGWPSNERFINFNALSSSDTSEKNNALTRRQSGYLMTSTSRRSGELNYAVATSRKRVCPTNRHNNLLRCLRQPLESMTNENTGH